MTAMTLRPNNKTIPRALRDMDEVLKLSEAAAEVGQCRSLLWKLCREGIIKHHQRTPGTGILIVRRDLAAAYPSLYQL